MRHSYQIWRAAEAPDEGDDAAVRTTKYEAIANGVDEATAVVRDLAVIHWRRRADLLRIGRNQAVICGFVCVTDREGLARDLRTEEEEEGEFFAVMIGSRRRFSDAF